MIHSGAVYLRPLEQSELPQLLRWRNQKEFRDNFREYRELSAAHQQRWFESIHRDESPHMMFGVCESTSNDLIGAAGLCYIHWAYRNADLSFYIGKDNLYADGLYGRDTVLGLLQYGFQSLNLKRIWCELYETDHKKIALLTELGFVREGILRANTFKNGEYRNGHVFGILSEEYRSP